ncbi:MAG: aminodeoxychorismate lyase [Methylomicrobium sp.]
MFLINGLAGQNIDVSDRGLQYGDGLFETIEVSDGQLVFFDRHLRRLEAGCKRLSIPFPGSDVIVSEAASLAREQAKAVLKIILTRGHGGRGYRQPDVVIPSRIVSLHPYPDYPQALYSEGVRVRICETRLGLNPALAGIKHLNRLEQVLARAEWSDAAIHEGLMLDVDGHVIEGTMTNLFYVSKGRLYTSPVQRAGIAGIIREILIELAESNDLEVNEQFFRLDELLKADEVFVCNSVIGLWPVAMIDQKKFAVGPMTRVLSHWLTQFKQNWILDAQDH